MILLSTKLKNLVQKENSVHFHNLILDFHLKNISINGAKRGCSGFIVNKINGKIVYVNTDVHTFIGEDQKFLYRTAQHLKDYSGGGNNYANNIDNYAKEIINMLKQ